MSLVSAAAVPLAAPNEQLPDDVGKAGPLGLLLLVVLLIAVALLVRSMSKHLKRLPTSFDPPRDVVDVPDSPEGIDDPGPQPGETLLEDLRRRPRAIEPPRPGGDGRPEPRAGA